MTERSVPVRDLLDLLPELPEFDALRQALRKAAAADSAQDWSGRSAYETVDRRAVPTASLASLLTEAESDLRARLDRLYDAAQLAFSAVSSRAAEDKVQRLVQLGEEAESAEHWRDALAYYLLALGLSRNSADLRTRALVQRRVARTALNTGDFARARHHYTLSLTTASTINDNEAQLIAATGLGNVASYQGRWSEADDWYRNAITLCDDRLARERAQLLINRSMCARERDLLNEAKQYLESAAEAWSILTSADHTGWYNNMGLLLMVQQQYDDAEACFAKALDGADLQYYSAMVLDNMAELALRRSLADLAESRCRAAEAHALAHGSPRALAEVYMRLGRIASVREDANGIAFFEKALDLARTGDYPLLVGEIFFQYGLFRKQFGEMDAARALLTEALRVFVELGSTTRITQVQQALN